MQEDWTAHVMPVLEYRAAREAVALCNEAGGKGLEERPELAELLLRMVRAQSGLDPDGGTPAERREAVAGLIAAPAPQESG